MKTVGVIGLGRMGLPIACNLIERGFDVVGYRRAGSPELVAAGGSVAASPAEVAATCDTIISIVPVSEDVEQVVLGEQGTLKGSRPGQIHLEMSTIPVPRKLAVRDRAAESGVILLDCPISGSPGMVAPRKATTFASGDAEAVQSVEAVLDAISGPWVYAGEFGSGTKLKYIANMLVAINTVATAEAMSMAQQSGLNLEFVQSALDESIASSAIWRQRGPMMRARAWSPAPGPIATLDPILQQIDESLHALGASSPLFAAAKSVFDGAMSAGMGELDISAVFDLIAESDRTA